MPTFDQIENGSVYEEDKYLHAFRQLNVNKRGNKISPHKPILLLAVMALVEMGEVVSPFIPISNELEMTFNYIWHRYVPEGEGHTCAMQYPFYHMRSEPFWRLMPLPWCVKKSSYSLQELRRNFDGAIIDGSLFEAFRDDALREELRGVLVENYLRPELLGGDVGEVILRQSRRSDHFREGTKMIILQSFSISSNSSGRTSIRAVGKMVEVARVDLRLSGWSRVMSKLWKSLWMARG